MARYEKSREQTVFPPGLLHRYVRYVPQTKGMKFTPVEGPVRNWTHVTYLDGELIHRERLSQVEVDIAMTLAEAEGHTMRGSEIPQVCQMYEVTDV